MIYDADNLPSGQQPDRQAPARLGSGDPVPYAGSGAGRRAIRHSRPCRAAMLGVERGSAAATRDTGKRDLQSGASCPAIARPRAGDSRDIAAARGSTISPHRAGDHRLAPAVIGRKAGLIIAALSAAIMAAAPAEAQSQISSVCGVTGSATAPASITYDPFSPTGLSEVTIPLVLRRNRGLIIGRTNEVSLVLVAPSGTPPLDITYRGYRVLYPEGSTAGRPRALDSKDNGAGAAGEIRYDFGSLFASDLSTALNLRVSVPPGTDLSAGDPIILDMLYICSGENGMLSVPVPTRETGSIRINVNTVSALQAYYAGAALDFGEIGDVTTAQVQAAPDRYTTSTANALKVRSSGAYEVQVRSQNDFRLTFPGGNLGDAAQTIRYSARFLGQEVTSNASFGTRTCARAGVGGEAGTLPLRATLKEGGAAKTPATNYADIISITFTPIVSAASATNCAGL